MSELSIVNAKYLDTHKIELEFNDGKIQIVDFAPFLNSSRHPEIKKYLNLDLFKQFKILDGDLDWNDFDLAFPIWDLHQAKLLKASERKDVA